MKPTNTVAREGYQNRSSEIPISNVMFECIREKIHLTSVSRPHVPGIAAKYGGGGSAGGGRGPATGVERGRRGARADGDSGAGRFVGVAEAVAAVAAAAAEAVEQRAKTKAPRNMTPPAPVIIPAPKIPILGHMFNLQFTKPQTPSAIPLNKMTRVKFIRFVKLEICMLKKPFQKNIFLFSSKPAFIRLDKKAFDELLHHKVAAAFEAPLAVARALELAHGRIGLVVIRQLWRCGTPEAAHEAPSGGVSGLPGADSHPAAVPDHAVVVKLGGLEERHVEIGAGIARDVSDVGHRDKAVVVVSTFESGCKIHDEKSCSDLHQCCDKNSSCADQKKNLRPPRRNHDSFHKMFPRPGR